MTESLDKLPRGSTSISDLSSHIEEAVERGWVYGTLMFGESQVRTGHLVIGILKTRGLTHALTGISKEFQKINADTLADSFPKIVARFAGRQAGGQRRLPCRRRGSPGRGQRGHGLRRSWASKRP